MCCLAQSPELDRRLAPTSFFGKHIAITIRQARPEDASVCGQICYEAFNTVVVYLHAAIEERSPMTHADLKALEVIMPPTNGRSMGFITSESMPDAQRMGTRLANTAMTVMSLGRKRCTAPWITASMC
jgi:hypothetical protein